VTRRLAREESGSVLIVAIMILLITLGLGIALAATVDNQVHAAKFERNREASFTLTEAALNAQALQLGRQWPNQSSPAPSSCSPSVSSTSCPLSTAITNGYTASDYNSSCPTASTTPLWKTQIRDNAAGEKFWTTAVNNRGTYDGANDGTSGGDGVVWVRATATVQCRVQSIVTQVRNDPLPGIDFPSNVITANFFKTTNQGRKVLVDTLGRYAQPPSTQINPSAQPSQVTLRCTGVSTNCADYNAGKGQIQPPKVTTNATVSSSSLSASQLLQLKQQAQAAGSYYASGTCPTTAQLTSPAGASTYVEGPCNVVVPTGSTVNSSAQPGSLIIVNGTFTIQGSSSFYGLLYCANAQNSTGNVVNVTGNGVIQGILSVDGAGGVTVGGSSTGIIYDSRAGHLLTGSSGASVAKGTWRQLPANTP
jgi:Tfp pilus assembly protein PilX